MLSICLCVFVSLEKIYICVYIIYIYAYIHTHICLLLYTSAAILMYIGGVHSCLWVSMLMLEFAEGSYSYLSSYAYIHLHVLCRCVCGQAIYNFELMFMFYLTCVPIGTCFMY